MPKKFMPVLFVFILAFFLSVGAGLRGIDFGEHWDEYKHHEQVGFALADGYLLNHGFYGYPSMLYNITMLAELPRVAHRVFISYWENYYPVLARTAVYLPWLHEVGLVADPQPDFYANDPRAGFDREAFILKVRPIFLVLSLLCSFWVLVALLGERQPARELGALLAAMLVLFSWQFSYHARWIAPDTLMAMFVALWVCCLMFAERNPSSKTWVWLTAFAAALAMSTKYTSGALLITTAAFHLSRVPFRSGIVDSLKIGAIGAVTFFAITPGVVFHFTEFVTDVSEEMYHYATTHGGYMGVRNHDIQNGWEYAARVMEFLFFAVPSPYDIISVIVIGLMLAGLLHLAMARRVRLLVTLAGVFIFYIIYFSQQAVFIARNYIFLYPMVAVLAGFGLIAIWNALLARQMRWSRLAIGLALTGVIACNAWFVVSAAATIEPRRPLSELFIAYAGNYDGRGIAVSPKLGQILDDKAIPSVVPLAEADLVAFLSQELEKPFTSHRTAPLTAPLAEWPGFDRNYFTWIGPWEVDYNYYPTWVGRERILIFPKEKAEEIGLVRELFAPGKVLEGRSADASLSDAD